MSKPFFVEVVMYRNRCACRNSAYAKLSKLISASPSQPSGLDPSSSQFPAPRAGLFNHYPDQDPQAQSTRIVDGLLRPSIRILDSRELPKIPLADDASLGEVKTWCTLQFASDQLSRVHAYSAAQATFDDAWSRQQSIFDETVKSTAVLFEELVQELEEERSRFWQQVAQTDALSHEAIDEVFLRNATKVVDDAVRTVRAAMDGYSFGILLAIRRKDKYPVDFAGSYFGSASPSMTSRPKMSSPAAVFVSVYTCKSDTFAHCCCSAGGSVAVHATTIWGTFANHWSQAHGA